MERVAVALHIVAALYRRLFQEVKKVSPQTKVFVSFQWDYFQIRAFLWVRGESRAQSFIALRRPGLRKLGHS